MKTFDGVTLGKVTGSCLGAMNETGLAALEPDGGFLPWEEAIFQALLKLYDVTPEQLCSRSRLRKFAWPRAIGIYLTYEKALVSARQAAARYGDRDYSYVFYIRKKMIRIFKAGDDMRADEVRLVLAEAAAIRKGVCDG